MTYILQRCEEIYQCLNIRRIKPLKTFSKLSSSFEAVQTKNRINQQQIEIILVIGIFGHD